MHDFYSFKKKKKKAYEKIKQIAQSPSILKWVWHQCYTDTNPNTSFKRPFIKLKVSALDFPHTRSISKSCLAQLFKTKSLKHLHFSGIPYCPARSHLSKFPNQILHQLVSCFVNSIHPKWRQWVCASLISYISDNISPWVGCRASVIRNRHYCYFSSSTAATEQSSPG